MDNLTRRRMVAATATAGVVLAGAGSAPASAAGIRRGQLAGKVAVVTGAARGIGRAICVALADEGAAVFGIDIAGPVTTTTDVAPATDADFAETGRRVRAAGARWSFAKLDIRDIVALRAAAQQVTRELGGVDILFANAGIQGFAPLMTMSDADWGDTIDVNLKGTANTLRAFGPAIVARGGGSIIVTSSTQGQHGTLNGSSYSASKWGLIGLAKSAALELGKDKVTVNVLIPGLIDTPLTRHQSRYAQALQTGGTTPTGNTAQDEKAASAALVRGTPLGVPWIDADDVAPMAVFLATAGARMASGSVYAVTGGVSAYLPC